jgi:hypothetical protein
MLVVIHMIHSAKCHSVECCGAIRSLQPVKIVGFETDDILELIYHF